MSTGTPGHPGDALSAYLDGELEASERASVEAHLEGCARCRSVLADLRLLARASRDEESPPIPAGLTRRVVSAVEASRGESSLRAGRGWRTMRAPLAAAAMLVVATGIWIVFRAEPDRMSQEILRGSPDAAAPQSRDQVLAGAEARDAVAAPGSPAMPRESSADENWNLPVPLEEAAKDDRADVARKKEAVVIGGKATDAAPEAPGAPAPSSDLRVAAGEVAQEPGRDAGERQTVDGPAPAVEGEARRYRDVAPAPPPAGKTSGAEAAGNLTDEPAGESFAKSVAAPADSLQRAEPQRFSLDDDPGVEGVAPMLILTAPDYTILLADSGRVTVEAPAYECSVDGAGDASVASGQSTFRGRAGMISTTTAGGAVGDLLAMEADARKDADARVSARSPAAGADREEPPVPWTLHIVNTDGTLTRLDDEAALLVGERMHEMLLSGHAASPPGSCDPLPASVAGP